MKLKEACDKARRRGEAVSDGMGKIVYSQEDIADIVTEWLNFAYPTDDMPDQEKSLFAYREWLHEQEEDRMAIWEAYSEGINS